MAITRLVRTSMKELVFETLRDEIDTGRWREGECLPSIKASASRFGTSVYPVHQAVEMLEQEGYVQRKPGHGTFVTNAQPKVQFCDSVALCFEGGSHVYGDLALNLAGHLHEHDHLAVMVDINKPSATETMIRLARSQVDTFVVHGHAFFDRHVFEHPAFADKHVISAFHWSGARLPNLYTVLTDNQAGGELMARHIFERGHRHIVVVTTDPGHLCERGPHEPKYNGMMNHGGVFMRAWHELGGTAAASFGKVRGIDVNLSPEVLIPHFEADPRPTAIFGLRDVDAP